jgi:enoyl-CoA hydratase/carnithine racemase
MIEPWLLMNWHRTMDWLLLAPTLSAQQALDWGLLNRVVPREDLEGVVEDMARRIAEAVVVDGLATGEVGVEALGSEAVEPLDRARQFVGGNLDPTGEVGDGVAPFDRTAVEKPSRQLPVALERVGARDVAAHVAVVEDHPARHRLVGVHRLSDLDVGVGLVAEPAALRRRG